MAEQLVDADFLSKFFRVDVKTINDWRRREGLPAKRDGYNFIKAVDWRIRQLEEEVSSSRIMNRKRIAALLGIKNEKYINELEVRYGLPKEDYNKFDAFKVVQWYIQYKEAIHKSEIQKVKDSVNDLKSATIRVRKAQAERLELDNLKEAEQLVPKKILIKIIEITFSNIRNKLLGFPNRLAYQVFGSKDLTEAKVKTKKIIHEVLNELSDPEIVYQITRDQGRYKAL